MADTFDPHGDVKPTDQQTVADIKAWLDAHGKTYAANTAKADLLKIVNE